MMTSKFLATRLSGTSAILCLALPACDQTERTEEAPVATEVETVTERPASFVGKRATLSGEVDEIFTARAFELKDDDSLFDNELLVLTKSPVTIAGEPLEDGDEIIAKGTLRNFVVTELESELDWDLSPELEVERRAKLAFVADSITKVEEYGRWTQEPKGAAVGLVSIYVAPDPAALAGQDIIVDRAKVQSTAGTGVWVGSSQNNKVFVAPGERVSLPALDAGDHVDIRGVLRKMPEAQTALTRFKLDPQAGAAINDDALYIEAVSVEKASRTDRASKADGQEISLEEFGKDTKRHIGATVEGKAKVAEVISDRAFWMEGDAKQRVLGVVREDVPRHEMIDIDSGHELRFKAQAVSPKDIEKVAGKLEPDSKQAIESQPAFLSMHWRDVTILNKQGQGKQQAEPAPRKTGQPEQKQQSQTKEQQQQGQQQPQTKPAPATGQQQQGQQQPQTKPAPARGQQQQQPTD